MFFYFFLTTSADSTITRIQLASANLQQYFVKALIRFLEIEFFPWSGVNYMHIHSDLLMIDVEKQVFFGMYYMISSLAFLSLRYTTLRFA